MYPNQLDYTMSQKFSCDHCPETFALHDLLKAHVRSTHAASAFLQQPRTFRCAVCSKGFTQRTNLRTHERVHTGDRPYKCTMCTKAFYQRTNLRNHIRTHTNERPYVCTECGRAFTQRGNLYLHERIHSGIRPFECSVCHRTFTQKGNLKSHLKTHMKKKEIDDDITVISDQHPPGRQLADNHTSTGVAFPCGECDKVFYRHSLLRSHQRLHQQELDRVASDDNVLLETVVAAVEVTKSRKVHIDESKISDDQSPILQIPTSVIAHQPNSTVFPERVSS